ncbi:MAG: hypothetical protein VX403_07210, partial [Planctomycetota bacterium]|nr:hypothetical protein [Planctomycetota bacterium]
MVHVAHHRRGIGLRLEVGSGLVPPTNLDLVVLLDVGEQVGEVDGGVRVSPEGLNRQPYVGRDQDHLLEHLHP